MVFEQKLGELWQKIVQRQHLEPLPRSRSNLPLILNELDFMKDVDIFQVFAGISVTLCCLLTSYVVFKLFLLSSFGNMNLSKPHWGIFTIHRCKTWHWSNIRQGKRSQKYPALFFLYFGPIWYNLIIACRRKVLIWWWPLIDSG